MVDKDLNPVQAAERLGISQATLYRRLRKLRIKLGGSTYQKDGKLFLTAEALAILSSENQPDKTNDKNENQGIKTEREKGSIERVFSHNESENQVNRVLMDQLSQKDATINKLLEQLEQVRKDRAEKERLSAEQQQRSDTIIMKLSNDLSNAVKAIEGSRAEIRLLENRMSEAVQVKTGKNAEPEMVKSSGWMKRLGNLFFVDVAPEAPDRCANMGSYDFRYL